MLSARQSVTSKVYLVAPIQWKRQAEKGAYTRERRKAVVQGKELGRGDFSQTDLGLGSH